MNQGADRGRTGHGVGQPDVERELRRFAGGTDEQQQGDRGDDPGIELGGVLANFREAQRVVARAQTPEEQEGSQQKAGVTDAIDDEGLLAGAGIGFFGKPETDQQVRAQPDAFPTDEQKRQVVGEHEDEHRAGEQVEVGEVAREAGLVRHVADRVDVDQKADAGDDQQHHGGESVDAKGHIDLQRPGRQPRPQDLR